MLYFLTFVLFFSLYKADVTPCYKKHVSEKEINNRVFNKFSSKLLNHQKFNPMNLPDKFDWREEIVLSPVQNQNMPKFCSACWAFAAASTITDRIYVLKRNEGVHHFYISVQDIITNAGSCKDGGSSHEVYANILFKKLVDDTCSPYLAEDIKCQSLQRCMICTSKDNCVSMQKYNTYSTSGIGTLSDWLSMMDEIKRKGPISCSMHATLTFLTKYQEGIYMEDVSKDLKPNYEVSVIGWGEVTTESGEKIPYWIGRNSLGTSWGENGFFRIPRSTYKDGKYSLGIENDCSFPHIDES